MSDFEFLVGKIQKRANIRNLTTGLQERARQGYLVGWKAKLGYRRVASDQKLKDKVIYWPEVVPAEGDLVRLVFDAFIREGNPNAAARWLNANGHLRPIKYEKSRQKSVGPVREWRRDDMIDVVTDEIYLGWLIYGQNCKSRYMANFAEQRHYHAELAIVDQNTFDRCREMLSARRLGRVPAKAQPYPFSGLLRCRCGGGMVGPLITTKGVSTSWSQKTYDCSRRIERGKGRCTNAKTIGERVVARALIPFVAWKLESIGDSLRPALDEVAREMSTSGLRDRIIAEAQADLADTEKQIDNLVRGVATGVLQSDQARHVSQELAEKKQRLQEKINGLQQKIEIEAEFRRAIERLSTDIEADLWAMFHHAPGQLGQLMKFMFEPASIVVAAYGNVKHREAEILEHQFTEDFQGLITSVSTPSV